MVVAPRRRVALATCSPFPPVEDDEEPLRQGLRELGVDVADVAWDATGVDWSTFDAVLLRTTWDYQDKAAAFRAWLDTTGRATRLFHGSRTVEWNIDKRYLASLAAHGVAIAPSVFMNASSSSTDLRRVAADRGWERGFVKPTVGANASLTARFSLADAGQVAAAQALVDAHVQQVGFIVQPYLDAVETAGERSLIFIDGAYSHGVRKVPAKGDYRVQEDWGATDAPYTPGPQDRAVAEQAIAAGEALTASRFLYARVDLLDHGSTPVLNELEVIEPTLFFKHHRPAGRALAAALVARL